VRGHALCVAQAGSVVVNDYRRVHDC
jgi:hypothetical protein